MIIRDEEKRSIFPHMREITFDRLLFSVHVGEECATLCRRWRSGSLGGVILPALARCVARVSKQRANGFSQTLLAMYIPRGHV